MGLTDYARRSGCWACELPDDIRKEMDDARCKSDAGSGYRIGARTVMEWLVTEHKFDRADVPENAISNHFQRGHHNP